jgi:hypothetical protein
MSISPVGCYHHFRKNQNYIAHMRGNQNSRAFSALCLFCQLHACNASQNVMLGIVAHCKLFSFHNIGNKLHSIPFQSRSIHFSTTTSCYQCRRTQSHSPPGLLLLGAVAPWHYASLNTIRKTQVFLLLLLALKLQLDSLRNTKCRNHLNRPLARSIAVPSHLSLTLTALI